MYIYIYIYIFVCIYLDRESDIERGLILRLLELYLIDVHFKWGVYDLPDRIFESFRTRIGLVRMGVDHCSLLDSSVRLGCPGSDHLRQGLWVSVFGSCKPAQLETLPAPAQTRLRSVRSMNISASCEVASTNPFSHHKRPPGYEMQRKHL